MSYLYDYSKLLGRLREKGLTQSDIAERLGLSECALNRKLKNKTQFKQEEMRRILEAVGCDIREVASYFFAH